jgi:hypothetical protein
MPQTISTIATTSASFNAAPRYFMILLGGLRLRPLADFKRAAVPGSLAVAPGGRGSTGPWLSFPGCGAPAGYDRLTASGGKVDETHGKLGSWQNVDLCSARTPGAITARVQVDAVRLQLSGESPPSPKAPVSPMTLGRGSPAAQ